MAGKKFLQEIEIELTDQGFVLWITENVKLKTSKKPKKVRHWLLDGSLLKQNGVILLGNKDLYNTNAVLNWEDNSVIITKKKR